MLTKILFYDNEGTLMMDHALCAYMDSTEKGTDGVHIVITGDCGIFIKEDESLIKTLFNSSSVDLTRYGNVVFIDDEGEWSEDTYAPGASAFHAFSLMRGDRQ